MIDIFISMDDSGKLNSNEDYLVFAGLVIIGQSKRSKFLTSYKIIIDQIKCGYCFQEKETCDNNCPEIKSNNHLKPRHRRRLMNLIEGEITYAVIVENGKVNKNIMNDKASRGRYSDYVQKRIIKEVINHLIKISVISPSDDIDLHLFLDEQPTVTNGYYGLEDSIREELLYGITNFNYQKTFPPILSGTLKIHLKYRDSKMHYDVQAADIIAGTIRRTVVNDDKRKSIETVNKLTDVLLFLP